MALGINTAITAEQAKHCIEQVGIGFLFAPTFHKCLIALAPIRKELGVRTIFNILGPLCNPASPPHQLIGVYSKELVLKLADVAKQIGLKAAMIVHGADGLDEISVCSNSHIAELKVNGEIVEYEVSPQEYGLKLYEEKELQGGDAKYNAQKLHALLKGERSGYYDAVILNSAFALKISAKVGSVEDGLKKAEEAISSGAALEKLRALVEVSNIEQIDNITN